MCPCFALGCGVLIVPCFSPWSAGGDIRSGLLSPLGKLAVLDRAVAIVAGRLLPLPLGQ
jgi:hypothetical protein